MANKKSAGKKRSAAKAQTKKPAELSPDKIAVKPETEAIQPKAKSEKSDKPEKSRQKSRTRLQSISETSEASSKRWSGLQERPLSTTPVWC